ncbi:MAG: DUF1007 family protein [Desulfobacterales bacterium]|nr:DUF1007 family protein [Desulfobacterales bacterium]
MRIQGLGKTRLQVGMICAMLAAALLLPRSASAHPHVFIYTAADIVFDEKGLAGFRIRWLFDEMFSSMIVLDFDENGNGRFEPAEVERLKKGAFANLREFGYFTHVKIDGKPFTVEFVTDFSARMHKNQMIYEFFVPCHVQAIDAFKEAKLAIYDATFYTSVFLVERPVAYENADPFEVEHRIAKNKKEAYYFDQIYPEEITIRFKRK